MLTATQRQESITKVKAWLGIPDLEHKTPADEDNPFDITEIANTQMPKMQLLDCSVDIFQ